MKLITKILNRLFRVKVCSDCGNPINSDKPYTIHWHLANGCGEFIEEEN